MSSLSLLAGMLSHSLGWSLLFSLLQGLLIYGCLQIVLFATRKASARTRYHIRYSALVLLFGWFALTWWQQWERTKGISIQVTEAQGAKTLKTYVLATNPSSGDDIYGLTGMLERAESYLPYLVAVYLVGVLLMSLRLLLGWRGVRQLKNRQLSHVPETWLHSLRQLCEQLGIHRSPRLFASFRVTTPMVIGALRPVILLPVSALTQLSPSQLEAILLHELAHIKRHDYLLNLFQTVMETLLCFNPFSWLIGVGIRRERELCCDDLVISLTEQPLPYAQALATLEAQRLQPPSPQNLAMAATGHKHQLFHRIKRIMEMKTPSDNNSRVALALLLAAGLTICIAAFSPSWAQKKKTEKAPVAESAVQRQPRIIIQDADGNRQEYDDYEDLPLEVKQKIANSLHDANEAVSVSREAVKEAQAAVDAIDFARIGEDVEDAMRDIPEVHVEVKKAMEAINWKEINQEIANAAVQTKDIDWNEIQKEINAGLAEARTAINDPALKEEIRAKVAEARAKAHEASRMAQEHAREAREQAQDQARDARRQAQEQAREARRTAEDMRENAQRNGEEARRRGEEARRIGEEARRRGEETRRNALARANSPVAPAPAVPSPSARMRPAAPIAPLQPVIPATNPQYEKMLSQMEADDLIDRKDGFRIKKEDDKLYINGKCQSEYVTRKYLPYLKSQEVTIKGNSSKLSVSEYNDD